MSVRETKVPAIPDIRDDNVKDVLAAIKATLEVREGRLGDELDQLVTMRELVALNVAETGVPGAKTASGTTLPVGAVLVAPSLDYNPATDFTTPPQPTGLRASGGFSSVFLEWDGAPFKNPGYTEIWRSQFDVLGGAVMVGTTVANVYADPVAVSNATYYYWVRFVSASGVVGPYNSTSGTPATVALNVAALLPALQDEIANSTLAVELGTRISIAETGITTLQQTTATSAQQITTLASVVGNNQSAIQIQAKVSDGLSAQYTVKLDVNGHVSGFGLASSAANGTPTSAFIVRADRFAIVGANDTSDPLGTLNPTNVPFVVLTTPTVIGGVTYPAGVWIKTAFIADATITSAKIQSLVADKITTGSLTAAIGITTGYISGGVSVGGIYPPGSFNFGTGFFLGNYSSAYQFYVGSYANHLLWNGSQLTVKGTVAATTATFQGLTVTDASGNILLGSGQINGSYITGLTSGQVSGLGSLATQNAAVIGSTVRFADGTTMNAGDFVNRLSQINSSNISTFIASAAIGDAYIGNLSASKITTGSITASNNVSSSNYVAGSSGWRITGSGAAEFNDVTVRGSLRSTSIYTGSALYDQTSNQKILATTAKTLNYVGPYLDGRTIYTSTDLAFVGPNYHSSYGISWRVRGSAYGGAVLFVVTGNAYVDHYLSLWYRINGGSWIWMATGVEGGSSFGQGMVSGSVSLSIGASDYVEFGIGTITNTGAVWNPDAPWMYFMNVTATAFNL